MSDHFINTQLLTDAISVDVEKLRKVYSEPHLFDLGDLRTVTLGGSAGNTIDSENRFIWV
ncbi:MAG: hypothetical protein CVU44_14695 [Chloroflexi bacterium HGW-Chloroflexi-6]|nr:MAG: hypothetical protein CVU44_14695 [Chloroflexi bacterium HGW-Chloroflexi-6]